MSIDHKNVRERKVCQKKEEQKKKFDYWDSNVSFIPKMATTIFSVYFLFFWVELKRLAFVDDFWLRQNERNIGEMQIILSTFGVVFGVVIKDYWYVR